MLRTIYQAKLSYASPMGMAYAARCTIEKVHLKICGFVCCFADGSAGQVSEAIAILSDTLDIKGA